MKLQRFLNKSGRWLPFSVAVLVIVPTVLLWLAMEANERAEIRRTVATDAERVRREVADRVLLQGLAFTRMARRWEALGKREAGMWEEDAALYYRHFPGTYAIGYVDSSYRLQRVVPPSGRSWILGRYLGFESRRLRAMDEARASREVRMTPLVELLGGGKGFILYAPIFVEGRFDGFISGVFRSQEFIAGTLQNIAPGYFVSISSDGKELFRRGEPGGTAGQWGRELTVDFYGQPWLVRVVPTKRQLEAMHTALDEAVLVSGIAMGLLLALVVRMMQNARRRSFETEAARAALEKEIARREEAQLIQKESEGKLLLLVNNIPDVLWTADCEGNTVFISRNFERMSGYAVSEVYEDHGFWFRGIHPDDLETVQVAFEQLVEKGTMFNTEYRFRKKNGSWMWINDRAVTCREKDGARYVDGIFTDITERKRAEEEIWRLNRELEGKVEERTRQLLEAQRELLSKEKLAILGQLSGSVSHELRNPLGVMSNAVYFLRLVLEGADETVTEYLGILEHEIADSQRIITDLLDFARTRPPRKVPVAIGELVQQSLAGCALEGEIAVKVDLPEPLPPILVDPHQISQVLSNLFSNARQAMPGGGTLQLSARALAVPLALSEGGREAAGALEITVSDTGEGISEENMARLFQPLFTTKPKGIGLGLVVCKNLVEANGGRIGVASQPGKGTTFTMTLPLVAEDDTAAAA